MTEVGERAPVGIPKDIPNPKERFTDQQIGNFLAAFGNHEAKCVTIFAMKGGKTPPVYTPYPLFRSVRDVQGAQPGWKPSKGTVMDYCTKSFAKIGLVVRDQVDPHTGTMGYKITEDGESAKLLAVLLLEHSEKLPEGISLYELLSSTASPSKDRNAEKDTDIEDKKRAPITRFRIFQHILSHELPIRLVDLSKEIGEEAHHETIQRHLESLHESGILYYDAVTGSRSEVTLAAHQREVLQGFVDLVIGFRDLDPQVLKHAQELIGEFQRNPHRLAKLMEKAEIHSSHTETIEHDKLRAMALSIIRKNPGITNRGLRKIFSEKGVRKNRHTFDNLTHELEKEGVTRSEQEGKVKHIFPVEELVGS